MTEARVTQLGVQSVSQGDPAARVSALGVQLIAQNDPSAMVAQVGLQVISRNKARTPGKPVMAQTSSTSTKGVRGDPHWRNVEFLFSAKEGLHDLSKNRAIMQGDRIAGTILTTSTPLFTKALAGGGDRTFGVRFHPENKDAYYIGKKAFTLELWVRAPNATSGTRGLVNYQNATAGDRGWSLLLQGNVITFWASSVPNASDFTMSGPAIVPNTWTHICVERNAAGRIRMYVNGVMTGWVDYPGEIRRANQPLALCKYDTGGQSGAGGGWGFNGHMDQVRFTKGIARYNSNAGFEVPTEPYPFDYFERPDTESDPYWSLVTCLVNAEQNPPVDLKRGATLTGLTRRTNNSSYHAGSGHITTFGLDGVGTIAHVDNQWDLIGRSEPFTLDFDTAYSSSSGGPYYPMTVENSWRIRVNTSYMTFQYWNGSAWVSHLEASSFNGGWFWSHGPNSFTITRDEHLVWRLYRHGQLVSEWGQPAGMVPAAPNSDLLLDVASQFGQLFLDDIRMTWGVARHTGGPRVRDFAHALPYPLTGPLTPPEDTTPEPSYPFAIEFPSSEARVAHTFSLLTGNNPTIANRYTNQITGAEGKPDYFRWRLDSNTTSHNYVTRYIPKQFFADIDAGSVDLSVSALIGSANLNDLGAISVSVLDVYGRSKAFFMTEPVSGPQMQRVSDTFRLPAGTRSLRVGLLARRGGGTAVVYNQVELALQSGAMTHVPLPPLTDMLNTDPTGWVDLKGGAVQAAEANFACWGISTTGKVMDLQKVVALPDTLHTQIDAGAVALALQGLLYRSLADDNDFGYVYVEFRDEVDLPVGVRKVTDPYAAVPGFMSRLDLRAPVPAGARKVVFGIFGSKDYSEGVGSSLIQYFPSLLGAYCYLPAPEDMPDPAPVPPVLVEDEHWDNVVFLLSTRNGNIESVSTANLATVTVNGTLTVDPIVSPFGEAAIASNLDAAAVNTHFLAVALSTAALPLKMTFEGWFMKTGHARNFAGIHNQLGQSHDSTGNPMRMSTSAGVWADNQLAFNEWYHIAFCRDDTGRIVMFVNGKKQSRVSGPFSTVFSNSFRIGYSSGAGDNGSWIGYYDEIRITAGVERYTEDFVPPASRFPTIKRLPTHLGLLGGGRELLSGDASSGSSALFASGDA